jgi:hypothetical protein
MLDEKEAFWSAVTACLVELHGMDYDNAVTQAREFRDKIESKMQGTSSDIFYHSRPFDVACAIARKKLELPRYRDKYNAILEKHHW